MTYLSPFGVMGTDHEWPDALCLSRTHCTNPSEETLVECYEAALVLIEAGVPQPAFFLARQLAELSLKAMLGPEPVHGHKLDKLLKRLEENNDDLFAADEERRLIVEFVWDLHSHDPKGDQGRYPTTTSGELSLAAVCCADPRLFRQHVTRLFVYAQGRVTQAAQSV